MASEWFVVIRDDNVQVIAVNEGTDPLYGRGSWNLAIAASFESFEAATIAADTLA